MNGIYGYLLSGKGDYASASIFLPAVGRGKGTSLTFAGEDAYYWSGEIDSHYDDVTEWSSWSLFFGKIESKRRYWVSDDDRERGLAIRPVKAK